MWDGTIRQQDAGPSTTTLELTSMQRSWVTCGSRQQGAALCKSDNAHRMPLLTLRTPRLAALALGQRAVWCFSSNDYTACTPITRFLRATKLGCWIMERSSMPIDDKDRYSAAVQLAVLEETTSWNRFDNFLLFVSILILSWVTIYSQTTPPKYATTIMVSLSALGVVSGLAWAVLGWRGHKFVATFLDLGSRIERNLGSEETPAINPCHEMSSARATLRFHWVGSYYPLIGVPILCSVLFLLMLFASFR